MSPDSATVRSQDVVVIHSPPQWKPCSPSSTPTWPGDRLAEINLTASTTRNDPALDILLLWEMCETVAATGLTDIAGATTTYVRASINEVAAALAALTE